MRRLAAVVRSTHHIQSLPSTMNSFQLSFKIGVILALCATALAAPDIPNGCASGTQPIVPGTKCPDGQWPKE
jgi:hypothetical protein